eukprot:Protomagalhaensia_wolfi_Nauph_80__5556@NODE_612_length_2210_cov_1817_290649_g459_i0_p2_GENE_NODE_612_length_2210_cov_1817_290649_g459_i0NODE_612_length_2210_cov_1817_290649_g459_i0_p2_ORF_typecomplete_len187_score23_81CLP_protease/PF00574_23/4_9e03CLP_protease/PF00574_23/0_043_NODE_612_length_2210_cov_1817_290649_g459_i09221482
MYSLLVLATLISSLGGHAATTLTTQRTGCEGVDGCPVLSAQPLDQTTMNNFIQCLKWASTSSTCKLTGTFTQATTLSATTDTVLLTEAWLQQFQTSVPANASITVNMRVNTDGCEVTKGFVISTVCQNLPSQVPASALGRLCAKYSGTNCASATLTAETILASPDGVARHMSLLSLFVLCVFSYLL